MLKRWNFIFLIGVLLFPNYVLASLQVFPLRVLLTEKNRSAQVSLRHKGDKPTSYRISAVYYKMNPDGSMRALKNAKQESDSAAALIRFSPKKVLLQPNIEQVVRIITRPTTNLETGEYRVHLHFEEIDTPIESPQFAGGSESRFVLKAKMAVAIPVTIRKGNPELKVSIKDFKVEKKPDGKYYYSFDLIKEGSSFIYSNLELLSQTDTNNPKTIATVSGISSYIKQRRVSYPLPSGTTPSGKVKLVLKRPATEGGQIIASSEIRLK